MEQVFQSMVDRSRAPLRIERVKTLLECKRRPTFHRKDSPARRWGVVVEKPTYDLTVFKVACGRMTLKIYTKGERVLGLEALVHNTEELRAPNGGRRGCPARHCQRRMLCKTPESAEICWKTLR